MRYGRDCNVRRSAVQAGQEASARLLHPMHLAPAHALATCIRGLMAVACVSVCCQEHMQECGVPCPKTHAHP